MADWDRLRGLVEGALALPDDARDAYIQKECAGDEALLAEVRELVAASVGDEAFLTPAAPPLSLDPVLPEGSRIGPYRLTGVVASGGMGTVYVAERKEPHRRVALKVMRADLGNPASVARFRYEVEVLASLRHAHIAHMYETGVQETEDHRELPWFAMEFVVGARAITAYAAERDLPARERVQLMALVCDAVHHGHGRGVIHRDLKPDNLLVDERGVPKIIDFGVAKAVESAPGSGTLRTSRGEIVGTLAYMSPEQVSGRSDAIGIQSDVYSLGVVLFELLTGALPHDLAGKDLLESARAIEKSAPRRAGEIEPKAAGDLETILDRCLEKDPDRRYDSAAALAADLRRFLAHEPIEAHPPSVTYQLRMFVRRHRVLVGAAGLVLLVSLAATVASLTFLSRARRSERLALDREAAARNERDRARRLFEQLLDRSVNATFELAPRLKDLAGGIPLGTEVIASAIEDLETLLAEARDDPEVRSRVAYAQLRLGDVRGNPAYPNLGDREGAEASYARAAEIAEDLLAERPGDPDVRCLAANCARNQGMMAVYSRDLDRAREKLESSLATFDDLCRAQPENLSWRAELGNTHDKLVGLASQAGDVTGVRRHAEAYAKVFRELLALHPEREGYRAQVAFSRQQLAGLHFREGRFAEARAEWDAAEEILTKLVEQHPEKTVYRVKLAWSEMWAGGAEQRLGHFDAAERRLGRAVDIYSRLVADDPANAQFPPQLANAWYMSGDLAEARAKHEDAAPADRRPLLTQAAERFRKSLAVYEKLREEGRLLEIHAKFPAAIRERITACEAQLAD